MEIPTIEIPPIDKIETISIPLPTADVPSYIPMVVPPSDLDAVEEPEGTTSAKKEEVRPPVPPRIKLPVVEIDLPLPTTATQTGTDSGNLASIMQNAYQNQMSLYGMNPNYMANFRQPRFNRPRKRFRQVFNRGYF